ncbi:MAG: zinc-dependent metalloprotease [Chitinophagaceae bacterium]|nr:zinc-dependent metalloprotease [Chitinophagaceae bacterium]MCB9046057.1 T9SS type A sorting domain-containing protein [Chitinophagales bacterium]
MFKKQNVIVFLLLLLAGTVQAQDALYRDVQEAHKRGVSFMPVQLFSETNGEKHKELAEETLLMPDKAAIKEVYETHPYAITLQLTTEKGIAYNLEMMRSNPYADNADIGYIDATGKHKFNYDKGVHYQGAVNGYNRSIAAASIFANGDVMILFANEDGNFVVGELEDNSGKYVLYNDKDFTVTPPISCGTVDYAIEEESDNPTDGGKTTAAYMCNKVSIYWELDYQLYTSKQKSTLLTGAYTSGLFNQVQTLYRNERVAIELKSTYVWTIPDGYGDATSSDGLNDFTSAWNAKGNNFDGDIAMLLAKDDAGNGGIAWLDVLCNRNRTYAYGDINGSYGSLPSYSWDVQMVTHEMGHNLGSRHTHWCGWKTGTGGACGSIDNCYKQESGAGCSTCGSTYSNSASTSAWKGTIMSYCHLVSRGIDLANGFGPLPGDVIRNNVSSRSCLSSIISATLTPTDICKNVGKVDLIFDSTQIGTSNFGASQYKYVWSGNGGSSQNITVTQPGVYSVTITDSNGCSASFSATVGINADPGCASTGINDVAREYVSMYPNPAHDQVMLKYFSSSSIATDIRLTDISGRTVKNKTVNTINGENNVILDLDNVQPGMYYITISSATQQYINLKLVVN